METIISRIKAELWYLFLQQQHFICRKIYSLSLSFHTVYHALSRAQYYFHSFLWNPSPHWAGHKAESTHLCVWPRWELQDRAERELVNKPCQPKPAITSVQHKFLPSRDVNRIRHIHRLKCVLGSKRLPLCQSCSITKHLTKLMKYNRNLTKMYSIGPHD